ncbi:Lrp/AsnC family transcriptional regulator [Halosimplex amylolyticum]|uniref:Lrp/AsnC family transcriptional regulator n=1 Tax=Halosimplex amylolyticum TaxID=3396616 RepID=UPI003F546DC5
MADYDLDDVDRQLLNKLQENARYTAIELAESIGVSDNTVHNRMERLEEAGVITGYTTAIDHDRTGLGLYFHFSCTTRISERAGVAAAAMEIPAVLEVTELMTGHENLHIKAVGRIDEDITRIAERLDDLSLEINDENLIRTEHEQPLDYVAVAEFVADAE